MNNTGSHNYRYDESILFMRIERVKDGAHTKLRACAFLLPLYRVLESNRRSRRTRMNIGSTLHRT